MALRGKKPEPALTKRLKVMLFGPAGVGKTTAAIAFPKAYLCDCERGAEMPEYVETLLANGSFWFRPADVEDLITEVRSLLTERHEYRTLIIDPISTLYNDLLDRMEAKVGSEHGRHYGAANRFMSRLANLMTALDMNVIVVAHGKNEYGPNQMLVGQTFDGWKKLEYIFDLVLELSRDRAFSSKATRAKGRFARVQKTRIKTFPDGEIFEWSYDAFRTRYDAAALERAATQMAIASAAQVGELKQLLGVVRLPDGLAEKWLAAARADAWEDMPSYAIAKCIENVRGRMQSASPQDNEANP